MNEKEKKKSNFNHFDDFFYRSENFLKITFECEKMEHVDNKIF